MLYLGIGKEALTLLLCDERDDGQDDSEEEQKSLNENRYASRLELLAPIGVAAVADAALSDLVHIVPAAIHPAFEGQTGNRSSISEKSLHLAYF